MSEARATRRRRALASLSRRARRLNSRHPALPALWLVTDSRRTPDPATLIRQAPPGVGVIFRHYEARDREIIGRRLVALCRASRRSFLVAGDAKLAQRLRADGLHLPETAVAALRGVRRRHPGWLVTVSAHRLPTLLKAFRDGADAVVVAPVFATESHPDAAVMGRLRFTQLVHAAPLPVYALGGIDERSAATLAASGAAGFAAIGAFL